MQKETIWALDGFSLFHYQDMKNPQCREPILIVFSTINKSSILDLTDKLSFIQKLTANNLNIFLLEWGGCTEHTADITIDDYVDHYLHTAIQTIKEETKKEKINLLGICQGGLWCLCYASLYADIDHLILIAVPVDFSTADHVIAKIIASINEKAIQLIDQPIPGWMVTQFFMSLRPLSLIPPQKGHDKNRTISQWVIDTPHQPQEICKKLMIDFYQKNKLIQGRIRINSQYINLRNIKIPILNIIADKDRIVPQSATLPLADHVGSKKVTTTVIEGGHISIYLDNSKEAKLPAMIANFIHQ